MPRPARLSPISSMLGWAAPSPSACSPGSPSPPTPCSSWVRSVPVACWSSASPAFPYRNHATRHRRPFAGLVHRPTIPQAIRSDLVEPCTGIGHVDCADALHPHRSSARWSQRTHRHGDTTELGFPAPPHTGGCTDSDIGRSSQQQHRTRTQLSCLLDRLITGFSAGGSNRKPRRHPWPPWPSPQRQVSATTRRCRYSHPVRRHRPSHWPNGEPN